MNKNATPLLGNRKGKVAKVILIDGKFAIIEFTDGARRNYHIDTLSIKDSEDKPAPKKRATRKTAAKKSTKNK